jgi:hypothetical protein
MMCEIRHCREMAVRPVIDSGFCVWACEKHGRGKKTYPRYQPKPTVIDLLASIDGGNRPWEYAYDG